MDSLFWAVVFVLWPLALLNVVAAFLPIPRRFGHWLRVGRICGAVGALSFATAMTIFSVSLQQQFAPIPHWMIATRDMAMATAFAAFVLVLALWVIRDRAAAAALHMPPRLYAWLYMPVPTHRSGNGG